ncbi:MAG: sulfatase [Solirubrobacterales bacterium]
MRIALRPLTRTATVLAIAALTLLGLAQSAGARPVKADTDGRPNILVVMTDDMATSDIKFMPNVRKLLADQGTTFTDAVDSFPLCCPARATFITGQYAHNHGVKGNFSPYGWYGMKDRGNILPRWLQKSGYRTAAIGKWLNGYGALDGHGEIPKGFDTWRGLLDVSAYDYYNFVMNRNGKLKYWGDKDFARKLVEFANIEVTPNPTGIAGILTKLRQIFGNPPYTYWGAENEEDYSPDVTGQVTQNIVRREGKEKDPFFVWWSPAAPHREDVSTTLLGKPGPDPRPAMRFEPAVNQLMLPEPPSFNEADISDKSSNLIDNAPPLDSDDIAQLQLDYQGRAGSLMAVDEGVGDLVQTLRNTHQLKNTTIVFLSDNGWMQGEHRIPGDKYLPYEESLRVPLIIRGPGIPKGVKRSGQVSNVDFAPTLLDIANAKPGRTMDGVSLLPATKSKKRMPDRAIAIEALARLFENPNVPANRWDQPYTGVRTDDYTYVVWTETGEKELYDLKKDPYQLNNVVDDPAYASIRDELAAKLTTLENCKGKACDVPE